MHKKWKLTLCTKLNFSKRENWKYEQKIDRLKCDCDWFRLKKTIDRIEERRKIKQDLNFAYCINRNWLVYKKIYKSNYFFFFSDNR